MRAWKDGHALGLLPHLQRNLGSWVVRRFVVGGGATAETGAAMVVLLRSDLFSMMCI